MNRFLLIPLILALVILSQFHAADLQSTNNEGQPVGMLTKIDLIDYLTGKIN